MPHLTLYAQLGNTPILGTLVGRGMARSRLGVKTQGHESSPKVSPMTKVSPDWICAVTS